MRLTVPGHGHEGSRGAPRGNLELIVRVREHKVFERDGHNLICQYPITFAGGAGRADRDHDVDGPEGDGGSARGSQTHTTVLRVAGHGMPNLDDPRRKGDLMVILVVATPTALSPEQEELFLQAGRTGRDDAARTAEGTYSGN